MLVAVVLTVAFVFPGYAQGEEEIVIGSIWDQVGIAGPLGQAGLRGSQLAVDRINAQGGIFGYPIGINLRLEIVPYCHIFDFFKTFLPFIHASIFVC